MIKDKFSLGEIAKLYYEQGLTQSEISKRLGISRPIVSNKLAEARELGIVKIFINTNEDYISEMERKLLAAFRLKGVRVVSVPENNRELSVAITARLGAQYFSSFIQKADRIGISVGWTLNVMASYFPKIECETDMIVQCVGNIYDVYSSSTSDGMIKNLSHQLNAHQAYTLPCPPIVENSIISNALLYDKQIQKVMEHIKSCNKLLVNIALPNETTCLYKLGYLSDDDLRQLEQDQAVGDICCRFFDKNGNTCSPQIDDRTLGISLEDIKKTDCVMGCIVGPEKAQAIYYALKSGLLDVIVLDSITASRLIEIIEAEGHPKTPTGKHK